MTLTPEELQQAKHFAFLCGDLRLLMRPTQRKIWEQFLSTKDLHSISVLLCSRKLGKSVLGLIGLASVCMTKEKAWCAYIAPTMSSVADLVEQLYQTVFKECPEYLRPKINKNEIEFKNGSKITFAGVGRGIGDSYDNLRQMAFDAVVLDEAGFPRDLREIVTGALLDTLRPRKGWMWLLSSAPKEGKDHPFWDYVEEARLNKTLHEYTILDSNDTPEEIEKTIREHGGRNSTLCRRELFNEAIVDEELIICSEFKAEKHVKEVRRDEFWQFYHKYLSTDLSQGVDAFVTLFGYFDFKQQKLIIEDEFVAVGSFLTEDVAKAILAKKTLLGYSKPYLQLADNNDNLMLRDLGGKHNLVFTPIENKGIKQTQISAIKEMFRNDLIQISPKCKFLIGCLQNGIWETDKFNKPTNKFAKSAVYYHYDAIDALSYLVLNLNFKKNPIPSTYKATIATILPSQFQEQQHRLPDSFLRRTYKAN